MEEETWLKELQAVEEARTQRACSWDDVNSSYSSCPPQELNHVPTVSQMPLQVLGAQRHAKDTKAPAFSKLAF